MRLDHVDIRNFRSIKSITLPFDQKCLVLVGINESGKSNLLRALSLLDSDSTVTPEDLRTFLPDEDPTDSAYVRFVFKFDKNERIGHYETASSRILSNNKAPILDIGGKQLSFAQYIDTLGEGLYIFNLRNNSRSSTIWKMRDDAKIVGKWKKPSKSCPKNMEIELDSGSFPLTDFSIIQASFVENALAYVEDIEPADVQKLAHATITEAIESKKPNCLYWSYSETHLLPGKIKLSAFAANPDICEPLKQMFALADITNISSAISQAQTITTGMRNLLNRVADRSTKHVRSVWKEYRGLTIELAPNGDYIDASIKDTHNLYDFARRSDGFKRFISFLLMVSAKVKTNQIRDTLILHDEPDASLHPSGARYLRDELIKISEKNNVVYSTHSIFMIDREVINRHFIVEKKSEVTTVRAVNESNITEEEVVYNALGYSIFENLKKLNIIFEGWRDKRLCQVALKDIPTKYKALKAVFADLGMCHAKGVKDIGRITPMLELGNRNWMVLSDSDGIAVQHQQMYDGNGPWYRYDELLTTEPAMTGEDFIKSEAFKSQIKFIRSEHSSLPELSQDELSCGTPKLQVVLDWLRRGQITTDETKRIVMALKDKLFLSLKPDHIEEKYYQLLLALAKKLSHLPSDPDASNTTSL